MVDFGKRLTEKQVNKPTDPIELYKTLDRAHDKGPLRPAQEAVLKAWAKTTPSRDVIIKLHTGQGKTLVGLLMLQSRINSQNTPVVYLCPDNFLIAQTCEQAKQFGIQTCVAEPELPGAFLDGNAILVTSAQKLFNGLTKFGLHHNSMSVDTILMDDAHACTDTIRDACRIRIPNNEDAYHALRALFSDDLEQQGAGTYADIINDKSDAILPVPYWAWEKKEQEVARILSTHSAKPSIKFSWPLLKNSLAKCQCAISGSAIEIEPYIAPLEAFGSYWKAKHRIFMSATVTDDAFLIKGLRLSPETIEAPLTYAKETWSGEKMVLLPTLIDDALERGLLVQAYATPNEKRPYGIVALSPSFARTREWEVFHAIIADKNNLAEHIGNLKKRKFDKTLVLVNRYDGIDLPDDTCRILIFDGKPHSESLIDLYQEFCRPESDTTITRTLRTIEQGMGRSVRGEKDYSVIIALGSDLIRIIRDKKSRQYLSPQMAAQIEIGLEITEMAKQEIHDGELPNEAFLKIIKQCLGRDESWKQFYTEQMNKVKPRGANSRILSIYSDELAAEQAYMAGNISGAVSKLQTLVDKRINTDDDKGWYLQEMARYQHKHNLQESQRLQLHAHKLNHLLLKLPTGVSYERLIIVSQNRVEQIAKWVGQFSTYADMNVGVSDILERLSFGIKADKFEAALDELSRALGFAGERPDKEWKEGPDNLWALDSSNYLLWECKNEVATNRAEINKREAEQMNRSAAWFEKHYKGTTVTNVMIHPAGRLESAAAFTHSVSVMRISNLRKFVKSLRAFFKSFDGKNLADLSLENIQLMLNAHKLNAEDLPNEYFSKIKDLN